MNCEPPYDVQQSTKTTIAGGQPSSREQPVDELGHVRPEGGAVPPHVELSGHPLDQVDRREAPVGLGVVGGREIDPERPDVRVAERVAAQQLALDLELVEASPCARETTVPRSGSIRSAPGYTERMAEYGTMRVKSGLAEMLKGGVIMDVVDAEQAKIAEDAGAVAVMALERVPADIRRDGGVARMSDPEKITRDPGGRDDPGHGEVPHRPLRRGADPPGARDRLHRRVGGADARRPRAPRRQVAVHRPVRLRLHEPRRGAAAHRRGRGDDPHEGRGRHRRHRQRGHAHARRLRRRSAGSARCARRSCTPRRRSCARRTSS